MLSDPNPDYAITIVKILQGLQKTDAASAVLHFFAVSPVKQYKKDQDHDQYMDGVVSEDRDGILLKGNHCTLISTRQDISIRSSWIKVQLSVTLFTATVSFESFYILSDRQSTKIQERISRSQRIFSTKIKSDCADNG